MYLNYPYLKEKIIEDYPNNNSQGKLLYEIKSMIGELKFKTGFFYLETPVSPRQRSIFIKAFTPCIVMWFKSLYSSNPNIKQYSKDNIIKMMKRVFENNNFTCLKKRILRRRRDISNNIILSNPIPPPPPPSQQIQPM